MKILYPDNPEARRMVEAQLGSRGINDPRILEAMALLPRHYFIGGVRTEDAYGDHPVNIGHEQTISQPYIVALMTQLLRLRGSERVLEIGTGSGYQTAVLAELALEVYTIERIPILLKRARNLLSRLGYMNIHFREGDGSLGWAEYAPFDGIMVTAAAARIPESLKRQLADAGTMVIPVGEACAYQTLIVLVRTGNRFEVQESIACRFVPLVED